MTTNATHWVSGTVSGSLTTDRIRKLHADRGLAARVATVDLPRVGPGKMLDAESVHGICGMRFAVVAIERTRDDEGRPSSSGAAIIYLREVSR